MARLTQAEKQKISRKYWANPEIKNYRLLADGTKELVGTSVHTIPENKKAIFSEEQLKTFIVSQYPDNKCEFNIRPDWLKNPNTGKNLELDIYIEELKLGFEFGGILHQAPKQRIRDKIKRNLCNKLGINIIYVKPRTSRDAIIKKIQKAQTHTKLH